MLGFVLAKTIKDQTINDLRGVNQVKMKKKYPWPKPQLGMFLNKTFNTRCYSLRFLNGDVLRNLNMHSFPKLCPIGSATCLSDEVC